MLGIRHRKKRDSDVSIESGSDTELGNTQVDEQDPVLSGICQLLQTLHQGLLKSSTTPDGINKENGKMVIEPQSRKCF